MITQKTKIPSPVEFNPLLILYEKQKIDLMIEQGERLLKKYPLSPELLRLLGIGYTKLKKNQQALQKFQQFVELTPDASIYNSIGIILHEEGNDRAAREAYAKAIELQPDFFEAYNNLGNLLRSQKEYEASKEAYAKAIELHPDFAEAYLKIAQIYKLQNNDKAGTEAYEKAIALRPDYTEAYYNLGNLLKDQGKYKTSKEAYEKAIEILPSFALAHYNLSHCLFKQNNLQQGWAEYEWRWRCDNFLEKSNNHLLNKIMTTGNLPRWVPDGGFKKPLVVAEQGIGDMMMFAQFLPEVAAQMDAVTDVTFLMPQQKLLPLFARSFADIKILTDMRQVSQADYDSHISIGSLAQYFRSDMARFANTPVAYLKADPTRTTALKQELKLSKPVIGISWQTKGIKSEKRNLALHDFMTLFDGLDVALVNLQYGDVRAEIEAVAQATGKHVLQSSINLWEDVDGMAALIELCDLVVSIDNSTVHLAGGLNKPCHVLLPFVPDFRWFLERTDSPWYPSLTLYRQTKLNDWTDVLPVLKQDLHQKFGG